MPDPAVHISPDNRFSFLRRPGAAFAGLMLCLLAIYGADIGHGFVKDDVVWVGENAVGSIADLRALMTRSSGFYRPVVALTFAADRALYDLRPIGYGVTNLLLLIGGAGALVWLARGLGLRAGTAVLAAAIWALNFHGINMAVLWLSGRTALLLVLWSLIAAGAFVRGWTIVAGVATLIAMLSKEEAVMLPLILSAWAWLRARQHRDAATGPAAALVSTWPTWLALAIYAVLRSQTTAYTPATSPWFYRFTSAPGSVIANVAEYADRACTFALLGVIVAALVAWRRPAWSDRTNTSSNNTTISIRDLFPLALIWIVGSYALTVFLPVRSSLYACLPSIGSALLAAAAIASVWRGAHIYARRRLVTAAIVLLLALLPVYWSRNTRWVEIADLSNITFAAVQDTLRAHPNATHLVFDDDRSTRRSLANTFGTLMPETIALATGRRLPVWLEPPPDDWQGSALTRPPASPDASAVVLRFRVEGLSIVAPPD